MGHSPWKQEGRSATEGWCTSHGPRHHLRRFSDVRNVTSVRHSLPVECSLVAFALSPEKKEEVEEKENGWRKRRRRTFEQPKGYSTVR